MKYKIIASDFDGTLLNSKKEITKKTKEKLINLKQEGYIIVGVTGRILTTGQKDIDFSLFDYLILNNGTNIYNANTKEYEYLSCIDNNTALSVSKFMEQNSSEIDYATINNYYVYKGKIIENKPYIKKLKNIKDIKEPIARINIFLKDEDKVIYYKNILEEKYKQIYPIVSEDSFDSKRWIGITPQGINKKTALEILSKRLNINMREIIFFGDGLNDLELIESNCISVAMNNALQIIKNKADYITLSNDEEGVIKFLDKFLN